MSNITSFYQRISGGLFKQRASAGLQGMFSDFVHCLCFCGAYTDPNHNIHIKGCMEVFLVIYGYVWSFMGFMELLGLKWNVPISQHP